MADDIADLAKHYSWPLANRLLAKKGQTVPEITDLESCRTALLALKQQKQLEFIRNDNALHGRIGEEYRTLTRNWTDFADESLDRALSWAWHSPRLKKTTRNLPAPGNLVPGLFILGLGKQGGHDLNFSSDVDLVSFYDKDVVCVAPYEGKTDVCANVLRVMGSKLIDGLSSTGQFVWRVDWRLRPDPSVTDLVISTEAGEDFYFFRSASWRRLAMMKARVVAGDKEAGHLFMERLHPFIWRRHLDYRSIDEIAGLKARIKAEHPSLSGERMLDNPLEEAAGFNLKLGRGGIREIEFFVNAQQLLWGGRIPALQTTNTLDALVALTEAGIVTKEIAMPLRKAYLFYRALENRMQYWDDRHTHFLPEKDQNQQKEWLTDISNFPSWSALANQLNEMRRFTAQHYDDLFSTHEQNHISVYDTVIKLHSQLDSLSALNKKIAEDWLEGFGNYSVTEKQRDILKNLGISLVSLILKDENPDRAVTKIHRLISSMVVPGQYLRLLAENDALVKDVIHPLLDSPVMESLLQRSPHLIDGLLRVRGRSLPHPDLETAHHMITASATTEKKLEAMRAWCNEQKYQIYLTLFRADCSIKQAEHYLTSLAEMTLSLAANQVCLDMGLKELPFAILAMGKLGMGRMTPGSDLDLIFICPNDTDLDIANKASRRFQNILGACMREGRLYEIDMRLRPSGSSGPATVTLRSFGSYHLEMAKTWEHLALVPARLVYGTPELRQNIEAIRHKVLTTPRKLQQTINDSWKMLSRLRQQRISKNSSSEIDVKLWPGGGMETEYLLSFLGLQFAPEKPAIANARFDDVAPILASLAPALTPLKQTIRFWRDTQFRRRLLGTGKTDHDTKKVQYYQNFTLECLEHWIAQKTTLKPEELENYREQPIIWLKK